MGGGGQISPSPIDFHRRPYNTLALPCERVIVMEAISREFRVALPWELLYADDLAVIAETEEELIKRLNEWKENVKRATEKRQRKKRQRKIGLPENWATVNSATKNKRVGKKDNK